MRSSQIAAAGVGITLLGALITVTGLGQNDTNAVIIGAISTATGLIITVLASIQESIQLTGATIVGTRERPETRRTTEADRQHLQRSSQRREVVGITKRTAFKAHRP